MVVGFSRLMMEFPIGLEMSGYVLRKDVSRGILDPLEAFCVYLKDESSELAIVVYDLLGIPDGFPDDDENVKIVPVATHTHSAPKPSLVLEKLLEYRTKLVENAKERAEELEKMIVKRSTVNGVCDFRDRDETTGLSTVLMEFQTKHDEFSITVFPCHPTVLGPENSFYSADLAGGIRRKLEEYLLHPVVYLNSCCGNISTRRTRKGRGYEEVERLAEMFVEGLEWEEEREFVPRSLEFHEYDLRLPVVRKDVHDLKIDERSKPGLELVKRRGVPEEFDRVKISLLKIDSLNLVFLPFEMFYESCRKVEDGDTMLINYAYPFRSYLVPRGAEKTYEWIVSPYSEDAEEIVLDLVRKELGGETPR